MFGVALQFGQEFWTAGWGSVFIGVQPGTVTRSQLCKESEPSLEVWFMMSQFLMLWCSELCCAHNPQPSVPCRWYVGPWGSFYISLLKIASQRSSLIHQTETGARAVSRSFFINRGSRGLVRCLLPGWPGTWYRKFVNRSQCGDSPCNMLKPASCLHDSTSYANTTLNESFSSYFWHQPSTFQAAKWQTYSHPEKNFGFPTNFPF